MNELKTGFSKFLGFKSFLIDSGVDEFPPVDIAGLEAALPMLSELRAPMLVHAELPEPVERASQLLAARPLPERRLYQSYLESRPAEAEDRAIEALQEVAASTRGWLHVLHLSSTGVLDSAISSELTFETCPHYLVLEAEEIPDGATEYKCAPPIRDRANRERLWEGLRSGAIGMIVSDHSPCEPSLKVPEVGDFAAAWGGISSLQLRLPLVWTEARERGHGIQDMSRWLSAEPARLAGLLKKGKLEPGADADLVVWNPDESFMVTTDLLCHRHATSPYLGRRLYGVVEATYLRGNQVWNGDTIGSPNGRLLAGRS